MKNKVLSIFICSILLSCNLDIPTENELTDPFVIVSEQTAYETLSSAYHEYPLNHFKLSLLSDDFAPLYNAKKSPNELNTYYWVNFQIEQLAEDLWTSYYTCIKDINCVLTRLPDLRKKKETAPLVVDRIEAEAKTLKALCYFELLQLFSSPLKDSDKRGIILKNNVAFEELPRASKQETLQEIKKLLLSAEKLFIGSKDIRPMHEGKANFMSLRANYLLQSRLALYKEEFEEAERLAKLCLSEKNISINNFPTSIDAWDKLQDDAAIFSASTDLDFYLEIYAERPNKSSVTFAINPAIKYETEDKRRKAYTIDSLLPADIQTNRLMLLAGKYSHAKLKNKPIRDVYIMRPQEAIFIQAETLCRAGNTETAIELLNEQYFKVLGLETIEEELSQDDALQTILFAKRKEFAGENIRFFDLKRLALPLDRLDYNGLTTKYTIKADDYRWTLPIPKSEYRSNSKLKEQNRGWRPFQRIKE